MILTPEQIAMAKCGYPISHLADPGLAEWAHTYGRDLLDTIEEYQACCVAVGLPFERTEQISIHVPTPPDVERRTGDRRRSDAPYNDMMRRKEDRRVHDKGNHSGQSGV